MKKVISVIFAVMMVISMCACGAQDTQKTFKVKYIQFSLYNSPIKNDPNYTGEPENIALVGQINGEDKDLSDADSFKDYTLSVSDAFKDCTLSSYTLDSGYQYKTKGQEGMYLICELNGDITLNLKDVNDKTHKIQVEKNTEFEVDNSDESLKLLLPAE